MQDGGKHEAVVVMKEIGIKLSFHEQEQDWTLELNGNIYGHVSAEAIDELVEFALVAAQEALLGSGDLAIPLNPRRAAN